MTGGELGQRPVCHVLVSRRRLEESGVSSAQRVLALTELLSIRSGIQLPSQPLPLPQPTRGEVSSGCQLQLSITPGRTGNQRLFTADKWANMLLSLVPQAGKSTLNNCWRDSMVL